MPKIISKSEQGYKVYKEALTPAEIKEADSFLKTLQREISTFELELQQKCEKSSLKYKYLIGEFLDKRIMALGITQHERRYVWEEIKNWVDTKLETTKDRSNKREFYDYCYRLYKFGEELVFSFSWRQWSEFLDRSITTKDIRLLYWLKNQKMKEEDFRLFMVIVNEYLKNHDTTVFEDDEVNLKYEFLYEIVIQWNALMIKYFNNDNSKLTKARREHFTKYKKKFIFETLKNSKFKKKEDLKNICENIFIELFVDVDKSNNFKKSS